MSRPTAPPAKFVVRFGPCESSVPRSQTVPDADRERLRRWGNLHRDVMRHAFLPIVALTAHAMRGDEDRARAAGYAGEVAETVAINPAVAINGIDIMNQWFSRPDYKATMENCGNMDIGVWSVNDLDRSVLVAVYGRGDAAPPVPAGGRQFGSPSSPP